MQINVYIKWQNYHKIVFVYEFFHKFEEIHSKIETATMELFTYFQRDYDRKRILQREFTVSQVPSSVEFFK